MYSPNDAGIVARAVILTPEINRCAKAAVSSWATARARSGAKVVAIETANNPCGNEKKAYAFE